MHSSQQFHPVDARHVDVAQQHVDVALFEFAQRGLAVRRRLHSIPQSLQLLLQHQPEIGLVFCDQNSCLWLLLVAQTVCSSFSLTAERVIVKVVPVPTVDCTFRVPPCSVKIP